MEVKRLETRQISLRHAGSIEHEVYEGAITDEEVALVQHNPEGAAPEFLRPRVLGYTCRAIGWWENRQTPLLFTQTLEQRSASCAG